MTEILNLISKLTSNKEITIVCALNKEVEVKQKKKEPSHDKYGFYYKKFPEYEDVTILKPINVLEKVLEIFEFLENAVSFNFVLTKKPSKSLSDINSLENSQSCQKYTSENLVVNFIGKQNI